MLKDIIDLKKFCWDKLDFSNISDMSKIELYNKPIISTYNDFIAGGRFYVGDSMCIEEDCKTYILCHSEETCMGGGTEFSIFVHRNYMLLKSIFSSEVILHVGADKNEYNGIYRVYSII